MTSATPSSTTPSSTTPSNTTPSSTTPSSTTPSSTTPSSTTPSDPGLAEALAYVQLHRLESGYADVVTRRAWDELAGIVLHDCPIVVDVRHTKFEFTGPTEYGQFIARQLERFSLFEFVLLNMVMQIDARRGVAAARVYMQEIRQNVSDGRRTDAFGVYHDRLERSDDGAWRFAHRHYRSFARNAEPRVDTDLDVFDLPVIDLADILNDPWSPAHPSGPGR